LMSSNSGMHCPVDQSGTSRHELTIGETEMNETAAWHVMAE